MQDKRWPKLWQKYGLAWARKQFCRHFMLSTQAPGAQAELFLFAIYNERSRVNIRHPAAFGMAFRVAYIMTELG